MENETGPIIDMTAEGDFAGSAGFRSGGFDAGGYGAAPAGLSFGMIAARLAGFAILLGIGVLLFWLAVFTLPLIFLGGLILYGVYRFQVRRFQAGRMRQYGGRSPFIIIRR
jgi:hypothetical protein